MDNEWWLNYAYRTRFALRLTSVIAFLSVIDKSNVQWFKVAIAYILWYCLDPLVSLIIEKLKSGQPE